MIEKREIEDQGKEMVDADNENRKPFCQGCGHEILEISQTQYEYIYWKWDEKTKSFEKKQDDYGGDADKPKHICHVKGCNCESENSDNEFLDMNSGSSIGVDF